MNTSRFCNDFYFAWSYYLLGTKILKNKISTLQYTGQRSFATTTTWEIAYTYFFNNTNPEGGLNEDKKNNHNYHK